MMGVASQALRFAGCLVVAVHGQLAMAQASVQAIDAAAWLAGCWSSDGSEKGSGEQWMQPAGGTMFGVSRTVKGGATVAHEFMQLRADAAGSLVLVASPSGQRQASFTLAEQAPGLLVFENLAHDYPQRVSYRALPGGRLLARIEGLRAGVKRTVDFPMRRADCQQP